MSSTPKTLTVTECHQLLDVIKDKAGSWTKQRLATRNYTMALLMLDAGLRVGEVVQLKKEDLVIGHKIIESLTIPAEIAKNKTERTIPLSSRVRIALIIMRSKWGCDAPIGYQEYAFFNTDPSKHVTTRQVERIIRSAAIRSIGRPVHPHVLRHTFATRLMRKTNARVVQELLGHKSMTSTQIYMSPNGDDLKKAIYDICMDPEIRKEMLADSPLDADTPNSTETSSADHNHS